MTNDGATLGDVMMCNGQSYVLRAMAPCLSTLLRMALSIQDLDRSTIIIAAIPAYGHGLWLPRHVHLVTPEEPIYDKIV